MMAGLTFCRVLVRSKMPHQQPNTPNSKHVKAIADLSTREVITRNGVQRGEMACNLVQWPAIKLQFIAIHSSL